jgi:hypothetical protein
VAAHAAALLAVAGHVEALTDAAIQALAARPELATTAAPSTCCRGSPSGWWPIGDDGSRECNGGADRAGDCRDKGAQEYYRLGELLNAKVGGRPTGKARQTRHPGTCEVETT